MTWWGPLEVLGFARKAGFNPLDAKKAAAIALVATAGADHWAWDDPSAPGTAAKGLFGIPDELAATVAGGDQANPAESAATMRALFLANGPRWTWHPVVAPDAGAAVRRTLDALDLDGLWVAGSSKTFATMAHLRNYTYSSPRIVRTMANYPVSTD